jgi:hypothetical protein
VEFVHHNNLFAVGFKNMGEIVKVTRVTTPIDIAITKSQKSSKN